MGSGTLKGRTVFITGASRGIGEAIAIRAGRDGANVVLLGKTVDPDPRLPGTLSTAAAAVEAAGGKALPLAVDVRDADRVQWAVDEAVRVFGGIDVLVNNASAIFLATTPDVPVKRFDLMHQVNVRATFVTTQACLPHLKKSANAHVLVMSPPLTLEPGWFGRHLAYTLSKYGMSLCVLGFADEFEPFGIAVNALWPRTVIATAAVHNLMGGEDTTRHARTPQIMADAAHALMTRDARSCTGHFYLDEDVLREDGVTDLDAYAVDPTADLYDDFFV